MLQLDPSRSPEDPGVIGVQDWAMRQTQTGILAILRYLYDWDHVYYSDHDAQDLIGRLIDDPDTDFGIIALIFWTIMPGSPHVWKNNPDSSYHRRILRNFDAGYWPEAKVPLPASFVIRRKIEYLDALETGEALPWVIPHRFFQDFPTVLPYFELSVRPDERAAYVLFANERFDATTDLEQRLRSDLRTAQDDARELGLVSANFALSDHLAFVRDAVRQTGPADLAAQKRIDEKTRSREFHQDKWAAIGKTDLGSPFHKLQALYHFMKLRHERRKPRDLPQSPINWVNRLTRGQQSLLALSLLAVWIGVSVRVINWIS